MADKLTVRIYQNGDEIYHTEEILELELDPLSYSGVDYWKQEARSCKIKLFYSSELRELLESSAESIKCGYFGYRWIVFCNNAQIFLGILPVSGLSVEYLSLTAKTLEVELIDCFGLLLQLAEERHYPLESGYLNPIAKLPEIMRHILHPDLSFQPPDTESYNNADVRALYDLFGAMNYQYAHYTYNFEQWLPYLVTDYFLLDSKTLHYGGSSATRFFGFQIIGNKLYLIYYEVIIATTLPNHIEYVADFIYRRYLVQNSYHLVLAQSISEHTLPPGSDSYYIITPLPEPDVSSGMQVGDNNYYVLAGIAYFSGRIPLDSVEMVGGDYKAKDLLAEYLQIANAVMALDALGYGFQVKNRFDGALPTLLLTDPIEFKLEATQGTKTDISAVALASQAIIDAVNQHYDALMEEFNYEAQIKLHILAADYISFNLQSPYDLINYNLLFDNYLISPGEIDYNYETGEINIKGRAKENG